jgi:lysophospholipase L1-like esterase
MKKVACVGDSITWGFTILNPKKHGYPAVLQHLLGEDYEVRNFGYNDAAVRFDADTPYVKKRVYRDSLDWNPDIVILMLGTNDTKPWNWNAEIFQRDYGRLVDSYLALPSHPRVVLVAPIRIFRVFNVPSLILNPDVLEEEIRPAIRKIAGQKGLELVDLQPLFGNAHFCRDGIHPQCRGARMLAETIYSQILR